MSDDARVPEEGAMPATFNTLIVARRNGIVTIALNRPEKKNAINDVMWNELGVALDEIAEQPEDRVVVLTGAGGAFSSGSDLGGGPRSNHPLYWMNQINKVLLTLHRFPKPTIAAVDGDAFGAGWTLGLACDVMIASSRSRFSAAFVKRGLSIDAGASWLLTRHAGLQRAKLLALTGDIVTADRAAALGLVTDVVSPDGDFDGQVQQLARRLATGPPIAQSLIKHLLNDSVNRDMEAALRAESVAQAVALRTKDVREGWSAFLERRDPRFRGS